MGTRGQWDTLATRLRESEDPFQEPALADLWALACREAPQILASFRRSNRLDDHRIEDLTRDLLVGSLPSILAATNPQAYFVSALVNAARSWLRKKSSAIAADVEPSVGATPDHALRIDVADFLLTLSERERAVLEGVARGTDRKELARLLDISSANLDQIVSRARKRFRRGDL